LVSYVVSPAVGKGSVRQWGDPAVTGIVHAYVIPQTASPPPADADAFALVWSSRSDVLETNVIPAVEAMFVTYATNGVYTSASFDTHMSAPAYSTMTWSNVVPAGATMTMKIRTATNENMSDNTNWTTVASPGAISPGNRQYVQFQATLGPDATTSNTPKLRSLTIRWPGESRVIDISGNFTKGPDYGVVEVAQSGGQGILAGVLVNLEVFEDLRAFGSTQRVTSALSAEIRPRNTGW
jgi:hypothetical protein